MSKYPSEIFGYTFSAKSAEAASVRKRHWCPFADKECYKQSRLTEIPFGVCSAYVNDTDIALCPRRFLDRGRVFADIALDHFKTTNDILLFPEVQLRGIGSFDFVMLKHKPMSSEVEDFIVVEFQTGQTTNTGKLVQGFKDFMAGSEVAYANYPFGVNYYDIWKRTFTQVLNKGIIIENWQRRIYWVVQDAIYRNFEERYNLEDLGYFAGCRTVFALYDLKRTGERMDLVPTRKVSASVDQLVASFRNNPNIPSVEAFLENLESRVRSHAQLSVSLNSPGRTKQVDVKPPSESGRVREDLFPYNDPNK